MARTFKLIPIIALLGLTAACTGGSDWERAGMGAATGAIIAGATDNNIATGAAVGAAAGALADDAARATGRSID